MTNSTIASLLTLICVLAAGGMLASTVWRALKSGEFPYRDGPARRDRQPLAFWFPVGFNAACLLMLAAIGVHAIWRMATAS